MKKLLVGILVVVLTLALGASAFAAMEFDKVKFSGNVTFSVSTATPVGLLTGSSGSSLVVETLSKSGNSWSASSAGWIKYTSEAVTVELNKSLSYGLYDLGVNIPSNPGVRIVAGPTTLVVNNQEYPAGSGNIAYSFGGGLFFSGDNYSLGVMANSSPVNAYGKAYAVKVVVKGSPVTLTGEVGSHAGQLAYYLKGAYTLTSGNLVAYYKDAFGTTTLYAGLENCQLGEKTKFTVSAKNTAGTAHYLAKTVTKIASMMDLTLQIAGPPVVSTATLNVSF